VAKAKQWAVRVFHGNDDHGYLIDHGRVVCVYASESDAEKDTKWLNEIHKKSASKTNYRAVRFKQEEGEEVETALQTPESLKPSTNFAETSYTRRKSEEKTSKPVTPESSGAAPKSMIHNDLSELFIGSSGTDGMV
jgi:hypothetical protein